MLVSGRPARGVCGDVTELLEPKRLRTYGVVDEEKSLFEGPQGNGSQGEMQKVWLKGRNTFGTRMWRFWGKPTLWDYVPSEHGGVVVQVNRAAMHVMKKRQQTLGRRKWRIFWSGKELLLQEVVVCRAGYFRKGVLIHSFLLTKKAPWVHESVKFCTTYASKQISTVLNGELAMRCYFSKEYIRTGMYEESVMGKIGGGSEFKLVPLWCLPLRFAGFSGGPTTWKVKVADCGHILVSFVSRWCHKDNTLPLRMFQLKIDTFTGCPFVKADETMTIWRNPHKCCLQNFRHISLLHNFCEPWPVQQGSRRVYFHPDLMIPETVPSWCVRQKQLKTPYERCFFMISDQKPVTVISDQKPEMVRTFYKTPGFTVAEGILNFNASHVVDGDEWVPTYVVWSRCGWFLNDLRSVLPLRSIVGRPWRHQSNADSPEGMEEVDHQSNTDSPEGMEDVD